jgi:hypothetical protein
VHNTGARGSDILAWWKIEGINRKASFKEKMDQCRAREDVALAKPRKNAAAERMARQESLSVNVRVSKQPEKDIQEWQKRPT